MHGLHNFVTRDPCNYGGSFEKGVSIKTQGSLVTKLCNSCVAGDLCDHMETRLYSLCFACSIISSYFMKTFEEKISIWKLTFTFFT